MPKFAPWALTALALATGLPAAAEAQAIGWSAAPAKRDGLVRLKIERTSPGSRSNNTTDIAASTLAGLDLRRSGEQRFVLRREAGMLDCAGRVSGGRGAGSCNFAADRAFADGLTRLGMARPADKDSFSLTILDARLATAQALTRYGARATLGEYIALTVHGASPAWLDGLAGAGQRGVRASDLIAYRIHGVSPPWVQGLADAGYPDLGAKDLVAMRIHGVTPEFARAGAAMRPRPTNGQLIARRIHGGR